MKLLSPDHTEIIGTLETVQGVAGIDPDSFTEPVKGHLQFEYAGETEIDWNSQQSVTRPRTIDCGRVAFPGIVQHRVFVDAQGKEWLECELHLSSAQSAQSADARRRPHEARGSAASNACFGA